MKLFITGATGYIGFNVATTFRRAGYSVWGLTRSQEKASLLAGHEIQPVIGTLQEPDTFTALAAESEIRSVRMVTRKPPPTTRRPPAASNAAILAVVLDLPVPPRNE